MLQKVEKVIKLTATSAYNFYSFMSHIAIDARKQNFVRKVDRLEKALASDIIDTHSSGKNGVRDEQIKKIIKDSYIQGYVKGWSELKHRYMLGAIVGIVIGYISYKLKESIDEVSRNQDYGRHISKLKSEIILIESDTMRMTTRLDFTDELDTSKKENVQSIKARLIRQHQDYLAHLIRIDNELNILSDHLSTLNTKDKKISDMNANIGFSRQLVEDTKCFLTSNILILIEDFDRALKHLRKHIVMKEMLTSASSGNNLSMLIESRNNASEKQTSNQAEFRQTDYFDICFALISFIYLIKQKKYNEGDSIYSVLEDSMVTETPHNMIEKIAKLYHFDQLSDIRDLSNFSLSLRAIHHNVIYSRILEAENEHAKPCAGNASKSIDALEEALKLNIDAWADNPQPMPYFSFFKLNQLKCQQLKANNLDTSSCDTVTKNYRNMAASLRDHDAEDSIVTHRFT